MIESCIWFQPGPSSLQSHVPRQLQINGKTFWKCSQSSIPYIILNITLQCWADGTSFEKSLEAALVWNCRACLLVYTMYNGASKRKQLQSKLPMMMTTIQELQESCVQWHFNFHFSPHSSVGGPPKLWRCKRAQEDLLNICKQFLILIVLDTQP